jgi:DNA/RNA endonuclease YhcR with UshA esterase domain
MRKKEHVRRSCHFPVIRLLSFLVVLAATANYARASDPNAPKYDTQTETKIKGTVDSITLPPSGHDKEIVHLVMKNGADTVDIYLCPKSFLDDMGFTFSKGDEITVTGSKVKHDGTDLVLAKQTERGNDTLVLRDDKGAPVWMWSSKK